MRATFSILAGAAVLVVLVDHSVAAATQPLDALQAALPLNSAMSAHRTGDAAAKASGVSAAPRANAGEMDSLQTPWIPQDDPDDCDDDLDLPLGSNGMVEMPLA